MRLVDTYDDAATVSRLSCLESSCWGRRGQWRGGVPAREGSWDAEQTARCLGTAPLRDLARSLGQVNSTVLAWLRWSCTQHRRACCAVGSLSQWFWPVELRPVIVIIENIGLGPAPRVFPYQCFQAPTRPPVHTTGDVSSTIYPLVPAFPTSVLPPPTSTSTSTSTSSFYHTFPNPLSPPCLPPHFSSHSLLFTSVSLTPPTLVLFTLSDNRVLPFQAN